MNHKCPRILKILLLKLRNMMFPETVEALSVVSEEYKNELISELLTT